MKTKTLKHKLNKRALIQRLRLLRREYARVSQRELARLAGLSSPDPITRLERGASVFIDLGLLLAYVSLAERHGLDADWLLTGTHGRRDRASDYEWLLTAPKNDLVLELACLNVRETTLQQVLRAGDDRKEREKLLRAILPDVRPPRRA